MLDIKLISSPLPPSPLSLSTPTFSNALTGGISWKKQAKGLPVADQAWAGIAMSADGTVSYASSSYASFSFSLEGVLRSLPALVSLVSLISFIPLSSLSFSYSNPFFAALQQQKLAATVAGGNIYKSDNPAGTGDNNWAVTSAGARNWQNIGMNGAGTKLAAIDVGGFIYTSSVSFTFLFCDESLKRTKEGENSLTLPSFQISFLPTNLEILYFLPIIQQDGGATW